MKDPITEEKGALYLSVGDIVLALQSEKAFMLLPGSAAFQLSAGTDPNVQAVNVQVEVKTVDELPPMKAETLGEDTMFRYCGNRTHYYELAKPGADGSASLAVYDSSFREIVLYVNKKALPEELCTADKVLQLIPMKQILAHYGAFLLHSSRISVAGKAILFTAPSQTGKTTQARLWREHAGAKIAGNDRTLLWRRDGDILTGGYPVDGSSPVYSSEQIPLGAVVVLRQAPENQVSRLPVSRALRFLMEQTALDAWNAEERTAAQKFWLELIGRYPVYLLQCRPDRDAVSCLGEQLEKDEVISIGADLP